MRAGMGGLLGKTSQVRLRVNSADRILQRRVDYGCVFFRPFPEKECPEIIDTTVVPWQGLTQDGAFGVPIVPRTPGCRVRSPEQQCRALRQLSPPQGVW